MSGLKGLLVDLDGTLVDTSEANFAAYQAALADSNVELSRGWWDSHGFGRSWRQFLPELLPDSPKEIIRSVADRKAALYPQFLNRTTLNEALVCLIEAFRPVPAALVTTASRVGAKAILSHHGLEDLFSAIVTGDDVNAHKPAPDAFAEAANRLGAHPTECLVIEDSKQGLAAAQAFGAPCLIVSPFVTTY